PRGFSAVFSAGGPPGRRERTSHRDDDVLGRTHRVLGRTHTPRLPLHHDRGGGGGGGGGRGGAAGRADDPGRLHHRGRRAERGRPRPDRRGAGHQGVLARQADLHRSPQQEGDRRGAQGRLAY